MKKIDLRSFTSTDELARAAAIAWLDEIETAYRAGKTHCVALSGGRIAKKFFAALVELAKARKIGDTPSLPTNVQFFWADERCVPPNDPESNFKMADDLLFKPLNIPREQIHRIRGEDSPAVATQTAESELRQTAPSDENGRPVLDLVFLGMGEDGHVASLFPDAPGEILHCSAPYLAVENSPKPPSRRISLSYNVIVAARRVWVLISGAGKGKALHDSLDSSAKTPLGRILQIRQKTLIFSQIEGG